MPICFFDIKHVIYTHDELVINKSGGLRGTLNIGLLDSILEHIQNDEYYPGFIEKLTHLVFAVNKSHAFRDGNKRTSVALGAYLLELNGYGFCVDKFIQEMENISVDVADNRIDKNLLEELIFSIVYEDDYSEELKLKLYHSKLRHM